jgi:hypothetical protein
MNVDLHSESAPLVGCARRSVSGKRFGYLLTDPLGGRIGSGADPRRAFSGVAYTVPRQTFHGLLSPHLAAGVVANVHGARSASPGRESVYCTGTFPYISAIVSFNLVPHRAPSWLLRSVRLTDVKTLATTERRASP